MAEYLIYFNQQWVGDHTEEWFRGRVEPSVAVVNEMKAAGVYVFAGGLEEEGPVYAADATSGETLITDGPYVETKEILGGFVILETETEAQALAIAAEWPSLATQRNATVQLQPVFVRR
jgi:hypothetical protein